MYIYICYINKSIYNTYAHLYLNLSIYSRAPRTWPIIHMCLYSHMNKSIYNLNARLCLNLSIYL